MGLVAVAGGHWCDAHWGVGTAGFLASPLFRGALGVLLREGRNAPPLPPKGGAHTVPAAPGSPPDA